MKTCQTNGFSEFVFVVCNVWYGARETYLLNTKLLFCYSRVIFSSFVANKDAHKQNTCWAVTYPANNLCGTLWRRVGKRKESLQLHLWNFNSTSHSPLAPRRLSCQIFANQRESETSANVNKHWKTRAKGDDVNTEVISANQHFASTFSMQIFKFQRRSCKLSFLFLLRRRSAPESLLAG